jgi:hypothetical protein
MKPSITILVLALVLAGVEASSASTHHQLIIHASVRSASVSGAVTNIVTVPISNATFVNAVLATHTNLTARDIDIVIDDTSAEIDVIQKNSGTPTVLYTIGQADQNTSTDAELHDTNPRHLGGYEVITAYLINLPGRNGPVPTDMILLLPAVKSDSNEFASVRTSFFGGYNLIPAASYILQGAAFTTAKAYSY